MLFHQHADSLLVWAPAKVNLYLEVLHQRSDGFHELETLMLAVNLYDTIRIKEESEGISFSCNDPETPTGRENLVVRAVRLLQDYMGIRRGVGIHLTKRIPPQAGLGGGSSDAAATLAGLNRFWNLGLKVEELSRIGAELGSDVPFFLHGPAAWCRGRGEVAAPATRIPELWLVIVKPPAGLPTVEVYRALQLPDKAQRSDEFRRAWNEENVEGIGRLLHNRLQSAAESLCPALIELRSRMAKLSQAGVLMSGSGTAVFALCRTPAEALQIARTLRTSPVVRPGARVFVARNCR